LMTATVASRLYEATLIDREAIAAKNGSKI
jgi:hypothetical protein